MATPTTTAVPASLPKRVTRNAGRNPVINTAVLAANEANGVTVLLALRRLVVAGTVAAPPPNRIRSLRCRWCPTSWTSCERDGMCAVCFGRNGKGYGEGWRIVGGTCARPTTTTCVDDEICTHTHTITCRACVCVQSWVSARVVVKR